MRSSYDILSPPAYLAKRDIFYKSRCQQIRPIFLHETRGVSAREKRYSTDDGQRFQAVQYPLFHVWRLLCAAPSTGLVLRPIDEDVSSNVTPTVFWPVSYGVWHEFDMVVHKHNRVNIWFHFSSWRLQVGHCHILHFLPLPHTYFRPGEYESNCTCISLRMISAKNLVFTADECASSTVMPEVSSINTTRRSQSRQTCVTSTTTHISYRPTASLVSTRQCVSVVPH